MLRTCPSTVLALRCSSEQRPASGQFLGHQRKHFALAPRKPVERIVATAPGDQPAHELGVEDDVSAGHPSYVVGEGREVEDPVLEEVAHASVEVGHQPHRVVDLHVLREQHVEVHHAMRLMGGFDGGVVSLLKDRVFDLTAFANDVRRVAGGDIILGSKLVSRLQQPGAVATIRSTGLRGASATCLR